MDFFMTVVAKRVDPDSTLRKVNVQWIGNAWRR